MNLQCFFKNHPNVAIALSGGVDSTYLLAEAVRYAQRVHAYTVQSAFQPRFEQKDAAEAANRLGVACTVLDIDVLDDPVIRANPEDRCYYCKKTLFTAIKKAAQQDGFPDLLDGTNASDDAADRPGMRALQELGVLSPLRLCGLTKEMIRSRSHELGLAVWNKPSYACLATRIPVGEPLSKEKLERTEWAENWLRELGFRNFRVRLFHQCAKLQVAAEELSLIKLHREAILKKLSSRYDGVLLDLEVRK
jgi:uncharacterized protein